jgi:hypothetical protein
MFWLAHDRCVFVQVGRHQEELMHGAHPTIEINVVDSQLKSRQALQMAAASEGWAALPAGGKAREVRSVLVSADYWTHADRLRPLSDAIH